MKVRLAIIHLAFALTGVATTMLGPILPLLSSRWMLTDAQAGQLFTAQFLSSVTGSLVASRVLARWGAAATVRIGMLMIACGVACLGFGEVVLGVAGIAIYGVGLGFALPSTNLWVAELAGPQRSSALNLLNFSWTIGALGAPVIIAALLAPVGLRGAMLLLMSLILVLTFFETCTTYFRADSTDSNLQVAENRTAGGPRFVLAVLTTAFLFLYVGTENGVAGWLPSFAGRTHQMSLASTAALQSCFWACILLGRLAAPLLLQRSTSDKLVTFGLAGALIGTLVSVLSPNVITLFVGVALSGLGLSTLFPTVAAIFTRWYGTGGAGSIVLGIGGLGGAVIPWLIGVLTYHFDSLRLGYSLTLLSSALAAAVFWRIHRLVRTSFAEA